jgi:hypothetical protein
MLKVCTLYCTVQCSKNKKILQWQKKMIEENDILAFLNKMTLQNIFYIFLIVSLAMF